MKKIVLKLILFSLFSITFLSIYLRHSIKKADFGSLTSEKSKPNLEENFMGVIKAYLNAGRRNFSIEDRNIQNLVAVAMPLI
jgi:hypothetical protein